MSMMQSCFVRLCYYFCKLYLHFVEISRVMCYNIIILLCSISLLFNYTLYYHLTLPLLTRADHISTALSRRLTIGTKEILARIILFRLLITMDMNAKIIVN